ncbi:predicted protein [Postia placenta Mad-698-R]|uniref:Transmembrane protein n=1 Tax=Postia placenta MAD-698-R-SB12 TaxID=670580 RepID=A0A1X6N550_9APHY|nr:hypothetical protein POSPLADRAFT_1045894 [Postia placenta MAD-698-R-SB12]EED84966.1 predicted protein [Postia placenta Mad-698-R]OSX63582.1 hypothetical protein POSPLADRAFT_1045894 [Postia placenta MAD-698-R-SB12]
MYLNAGRRVVWYTEARCNDNAGVADWAEASSGLFIISSMPHMIHHPPCPSRCIVNMKPAARSLAEKDRCLVMNLQNSACDVGVGSLAATSDSETERTLPVPVSRTWHTDVGTMILTLDLIRTNAFCNMRVACTKACGRNISETYSIVPGYLMTPWEYSLENSDAPALKLLFKYLETAARLFAESTWLQGALLSNIVYGVELALFGICFKLLVQHTNRQNYRRQLFFLSFVTLVFILGTVFVYKTPLVAQRCLGIRCWIPVDELGEVSWVVGNWLMDMLMVWRCIVIFSNIHGVSFWPAMVLPCLLFRASFSFGVLFLVKTSHTSPYGAVGFSVAYIATSLRLNIIITVFIAARLLYYRHHFGFRGIVLGIFNPVHCAATATIPAGVCVFQAMGQVQARRFLTQLE